MKSYPFLGSLLAVSLSWSATVYVNQAGYNANFPKVAVVKGDASLAGASFSLTSSGTVVHTGTLSQALTVSDWSSSPYFQADFSDFATPGTYKLQVSENGSVVSSYAFQIQDGLYSSLALPKLMSYFENDRADASGVLSKDRAISKYGDYSGKTYDVHGGWYDAAGDISKYLSHLSYANYLSPQQTPLTVWALTFVKERNPQLLATANLSTQVQAEALWGADFLLRMLDPEGYFYATVFDGWTGILDDRKITSFSNSGGDLNANYQAAMREGGGMSIAALARISAWGVAGDSSAAAYLAGAERAYAHLKTNNATYCDNHAENIIDDYAGLMAASELYQSTKKTEYLTDARTRAASLVSRLSEEGYFFSDDAKTRPYWHASDAGLPLVALVRYLEVEPEAKGAEVVAAIQKHLSYLVKVTKAVANPFGYARQTFKSQSTIQTGFFIPHDNESNYWWQGENARLASLASAAFLAGRMVYGEATKPYGIPDSLLRYGVSQLDWILGNNPYNLSFFHGLGSVNSAAYFNASSKAGQLQGGIANGITGSQTNGGGISFKTGSDFPDAVWDAWRWTEQWIPHSTWFLMAIATLNDESPKTPVRLNHHTSLPSQASEIKMHRFNGGFELVLQSPQIRDVSVLVTDIHGRTLVNTRILAGNSRVYVSSDKLGQGIHFVKVGNATLKFFRG